ncbi:cyclic nucleotide gated channel beta 1 [Tyrophagus putrescentiae]|nr:cyclic nucleotide gated channel beta 1 [Tyrophagus putrescentiae]
MYSCHQFLPTAFAKEDVEQLLQEAIEGDDAVSAGDENRLREVNFGISQTTGFSSLNYDELNDDTLLMASDPDVRPRGGRQPRSSSALTPTATVISSEDDELSSFGARSEHPKVTGSASASVPPNISFTHVELILADFRLDSEDYEGEGEGNQGIKVVVVDEAEASRRYLTIHSAPLYRWSEGMLPSIAALKAKQEEANANASVADQHTAAEDSHEEEGEEKKMLLQSVQNGPSIPAFDEAAKGHPPLNSLRSPWIAERLRHLAKAYNDRTSFVKKELANYSDSEDSEDSSDQDCTGDDTDGEERRAAAERRRREHFTFESIFGEEWDNTGSQEQSRQLLQQKVAAIGESPSRTFEPASSLNVLWLALLATAFTYNATCVLFRAVFFPTASSELVFFVLDLATDLLDVAWFKARLRFVEAGQWMEEVTLTRAHYRRQRAFKVDLVAILPLDLLLWAYLGEYQHPVLWPLQRLFRLNRLLKVDAFWAFFARIDALSTHHAYVFRIVHTLCYKMAIIHLGTCAYFLVSRLQGFGSTPWTYDYDAEEAQHNSAYLRCFYFSFRTTTSIGGHLPKPTTPFERVYMTVAWMLGVFVFAMVIGQIRDIVANAARDADHYRAVLDQSAAVMRRMGVPSYVQARVRSWLNATWDLQKTFNKEGILQVLQLKSRTDIALSVHLATLSRNVLRDLVLKLRPILFLLDDYVCRQGDVGHEMYIVNKGRIQVLSGRGKAGSGSVLITLGEGSIFGEIAILNLEGFTRRTADVRSVGYSQLFALTKADLWETLKNYPEYQAVLKRKRAAQQQQQQHQQQRQQQRASRKRRNRARGSRQATLEEKDDVPRDHVALQMPLIVPKVEVQSIASTYVNSLDEAGVTSGEEVKIKVEEE